MELIEKLLSTNLPVQIICQVNGNEHTSGRRVDTHVVCGVVQELGPGVAFNVMGIIVPPAQLDINPILLSSGTIHHIPAGRERSGIHTSKKPPISPMSQNHINSQSLHLNLKIPNPFACSDQQAPHLENQQTFEGADRIQGWHWTQIRKKSRQGQFLK